MRREEAQANKRVSKIHAGISGRRLRTKAVSKGGPRVTQVFLQLIVNKAKGENQEVEEYPDREKQATATLVDHPDMPLV